MLIGGQAGDGIHEAAINLGEILSYSGFEVFLGLDYPSLIRGGHNFCRVSFSPEKVYNDHAELDMILALNQETVTLHQTELKKGGLIIGDEATKPGLKNKDFCQEFLPATDLVKELKAKPIMRTSVLLGALCFSFGIKFNTLEKVFKKEFKDKAALNIALARRGFVMAAEDKFCQLPLKTKPRAQAKRLMDGNQAFGLGLVKAGMKFYVGYPMTPATTIFHHLAKHEKELGIKTVQAENEIAVINMALGSVYAGARTALGTSGGGFDLMEEGFSLAGGAEAPIVVGLSQRMGPSTGAPTYTGQGDLKYALGAGHGEFLRIILAAGDAEEAYELGGLSMNLAWKYQVPVIVMLDRQLSENSMSVDLNKIIIKAKPAKLENHPGKNYKRYKITPDGVSPLAFPGASPAVVKWTSYEHDEAGYTNDDPKSVFEQFNKRFRKEKNILKELGPGLKVYGDKKSKNIIVFWGSTKGAVLEAMKKISKPAKLVQVVALDPFDGESFLKQVAGAKNIIDVEGNYGGQLAALIREKTGLEIKKKILKYDARPFEPCALAKQLEKLL